MKKLLFTFIFLSLTLSLSAQSVTITSALAFAPLQSVEANGFGSGTINVYELSGQPVPADSNGLPNVSIEVTLSSVELTNGDITLISGNLVNYFNATYDSATNIITFAQSAIIPADTMISATFPFTVTQNSDLATSSNGFIAQLSAADPGTYAQAYSSVYTYTYNDTFAVNDYNNTYVDTAVSGNVLTNDVDIQGDTQIVETIPITNPTNGNVVLNVDGTYTYTPTAGFVGIDTFEYRICDNAVDSACDTAIVTIEVMAILIQNSNDKPIANDDTATTEVDIPVSGNVIPNDFDPDGDTLTVNTTPTTAPTNGTLVINPSGTFTYTPNAGFEGTDSFVYEVCDNGAPILCDTATVTIDVLPSNNGANDTYANDDAVNGDQNTTLSGNVLDNDTDPEGDIQTVNTIPVTPPTNGTLTLNANGTFDYVPNTDFSGTDSFVYEVCDNANPVITCDKATVYITVNKIFPDYSPTIITSVPNVIGSNIDIDFVAVITETNNITSDGSQVQLRFIKSNDIVITFDPTLTTLNGFSVDNSVWTFDDTNPFLYTFTYNQNGGIYNGGDTLFLGINAKMLPEFETKGTKELTLTVLYGSGGEKYYENNNDQDYINYSNQ